MKIKLLISTLLLIVGCELKSKSPNYMTPTRPAGVPVVNCDNDTIVWDWKYQVAYNEDRLHFSMDPVNDCVTVVILEK